ncbi:hypothetical protein [Carboxylicivirga caseinilyticus]|uniref:hypothetical protein n=1 Tax=Carboxylicivirga caseinilyticus TaxID=3417572 RepID=UPI003D346CA3|nr:hypothetical protein [Marinilabiliaceae bacterium A049]
MIKHKYLTLLMVVFMMSDIMAQLQSHYEDYQYSPFERYVYQPGSNLHTSVRQYRLDELNKVFNTDSVLYDGLRVPSGELNFWKRIFHDDLIQLKKDDIRIVINPLFNFEYGKENVEGKTTYTNTRGLFIEGNIGKHVHFYTDFIETQAVVPNYIDAFANEYDIMPGWGKRKNYAENGHDFANVTAYVAFDLAKYFSLQVGNGKHFFGDGHRSMLLSDVAFSYPYVKLTADFWKIEYTVLYNKMLQYDETKVPNDYRFPGKYGVFQYLDLNIGKRASLGLFASVVYAEQDTTGYRGFDWHYLNPVAFMRPVEYALGSPDNVTLGFNARYIAARWLTFYGQFVLGEFKADEVFGGTQWWANKNGFQLGLKTFDLFGIKKLDLQAEYNQARPYLYSHYTSIYANSHYRQPLAHILGANFREGFALLKYRHRRWMFKAELMTAMYGEDYGDGVSWGKNVIVDSNNRPTDENGRYIEYGHYIGQGLRTNVYNADINISYLINPRNMFNLVAGARLRKLTNDEQIEETQHFYFGVRTSIKSIYNNF